MDGSEENDDDFGTFYHVKVHPGDEDHFCMVTSEELELHTPSEDTDEDHCDVRRLVTSLHEDQTVSQVVELISQEGFDFKLRDKISFSDIISVRPEQSTVRVITRDRTVLLEMADRSLADECASDVLERLEEFVGEPLTGSCTVNVRVDAYYQPEAKYFPATATTAWFNEGAFDITFDDGMKKPKCRGLFLRPQLSLDMLTPGRVVEVKLHADSKQFLRGHVVRVKEDETVHVNRLEGKVSEVTVPLDPRYLRFCLMSEKSYMGDLAFLRAELPSLQDRNADASTESWAEEVSVGGPSSRSLLPSSEPGGRAEWNEQAATEAALGIDGGGLSGNGAAPRAARRASACAVIDKKMV